MTVQIKVSKPYFSYSVWHCWLIYKVAFDPVGPCEQSILEAGACCSTVCMLYKEVLLFKSVNEILKV